MKSEKFQAVFLHPYSHNYEAPRLYISVDATRGMFDLFQTAHTEFRILLKKKKERKSEKKTKTEQNYENLGTCRYTIVYIGISFQNCHSSSKIHSASVSNLSMYHQYAFYFFLHRLFIKNGQQTILFKNPSSD